MSRRTLWTATLAVLAIVVLLALGTRAWLARKAAAPAPAAPGAAQALAIELAPSDVAPVVRTELTRALTVNGSLRAANSAFVKARVAGEIRELGVREGDRVAAGQLLGRLDATEYEWRLRQAEDLARSAEAQLQIAERTLANNRALVDQGFISTNALDTAVSSASGARAQLQAAHAAAELAKKAVRDAEIRAPIAGLVAQRLAQPGERVALDARLLEIVDLARIELEAAVAAEDVPALRVGQRARVAIDGLAEPVAARVARIAPSATSGTRAVMAYLELDAHPGLRQGLFARATIELERRAALVVPASALRFDQTRPYVLTLEQGAARAREVSAGARGEARIGGVSEAAVEVASGLAEGATVLRGTVGALRAGTRLELAPASRSAGAASAASAAAPATRP